jgi:hypothetical protein
MTIWLQRRLKMPPGLFHTAGNTAAALIDLM